MFRVASCEKMINASATIQVTNIEFVIGRGPMCPIFPALAGKPSSARCAAGAA